MPLCMNTQHSAKWKHHQVNTWTGKSISGLLDFQLMLSQFTDGGNIL